MSVQRPINVVWDYISPNDEDETGLEKSDSNPPGRAPFQTKTWILAVGSDNVASS